MAIRQLSIFLENRKGRLHAIAKMMGDVGVNISAISVADTAEFGILRLIVNNVSAAEEVLKKNNVVFHTNDVTALRVSTTPGSLAKILSLLNDSSINVEYMYTLAETKTQDSVMILRFSDASVARDILRKNGVILLDDKDLGIR